jgi:hypothetical protein
MKLLALSVALVALVGCGGASPPAKTAETTTTEGTTTTTTTSAKREAAPTLTRDPKIMQLATAAAACKWEDDHFVDEDECAAYKAWKDEEDLFADGKGNDTLFAMLGDPDVKMRILATEKSIDEERKYFSDRGKAAQLLALVKAEQNEEVARDLTRYVTRLDAEALGIESDVLALAKSPITGVRKGLSSIIAENQGPTRRRITASPQ